MPHIIGSTTFSTAAAVSAASTALPPSISTRSPAAEASGWLVAIIPFRASTGERPSFVSFAGRLPWANAPAALASTKVTKSGAPVRRMDQVMGMAGPIRRRDLNGMAVFRSV